MMRRHITTTGRSTRARVGSLPHHVLALTPSQGLGGGIDAYCVALLGALRDLGIDVNELSLTSSPAPPGPLVKARYLSRVALAAFKLRPGETDVLCFHAGLLPAAFLAQIVSRASFPMLSFFYGIEIWTSGPIARHLRRPASVQIVTISSFSAGTLVDAGTPLVLPPGVRPSVAERLLSIKRGTPRKKVAEVLSVFRLEDYAYKGGRQLVEAIASLREEGHLLRLTISGRDASVALLEEDLARHETWLRVVRSPSDDDLAAAYERADIFALATRQHRRPFPAGEGFGIVLAEAALAGLPVVAPAHGGSHDAFLQGITGVSPRDESCESLADSLRRMVEDPDTTIVMGQNARAWARRNFDPGAYRNRVAQTLWRAGSTDGALGLHLN